MYCSDKGQKLHDRLIYTEKTLDKSLTCDRIYSKY